MRIDLRMEREVGSADVDVMDVYLLSYDLAELIRLCTDYTKISATIFKKALIVGSLMQIL